MHWHPTLVLLPRKSYGWRSLVDCSLWGREESDTTEQLHFHFSLSGIGEGNGNPLQWSCLEDPRDGGAWWAAIYGVAQSRTRLKRLSSSSSMKYMLKWDLCDQFVFTCFFTLLSFYPSFLLYCSLPFVFEVFIMWSIKIRTAMEAMRNTFFQMTLGTTFYIGEARRK